MRAQTELPTANASSSSCETGSLAFLSRQLYLVSFLYGNETLMLSHFVQYYTRVVGVLPSHMRFLLDSAGAMEQTKRAVALLVAAGINESSVQVLTGPLSPTGANYSESLKMRSINVFIRSLPKNAYVINSDVDELFSYPCDMERRVTKPDSPSQIWCGLMVDRMASDGKVRALLAEPDISLQFPLPCYMRSHLRSNNKFHKVVLSRVYRTDGATTARAFESAHEIHKMWGHYGSCRLLPSVAGRGQLAHYSMTR